MGQDNKDNQSDGQSTYDRKQQAGVKKGSTFKTYRDGKYIGVDHDLKNKIEDQKEQKFIESGNTDIPFLTLKPLEGALKKGSIKTRTFFTEKVLSSTKAKKNIGYTSAEFRNLSLDEQNKVYAGYMKGRMSGGTDAYGNIKPGWSRDPNGEFRQMNDDGGANERRLTQEQIETESAAEMKKNQASDEQADYSKKKRLSVTSSRSLFANEGGRGFFN
tara:strand:- start:58 stop:705 length:648 start_codon:yes stop_codon:yes gene_type:complete